MNTTTRLGNLESAVADMAATLSLIAARLDGDAPARPAQQRKQAKSRRVAVKTLALTADRRKAFIAAAAKEGVDLAHFSTKSVAAYCVENNYAPKGFHIGEGYTAMFS